jgi:hypothetical protein
VLVSHTTRVLHVTDIFWGCYSNSLIVKFDEAVHVAMDDHYSTLHFSMYDTDGTQLTDHDTYWSILYNYVMQLTFLNELNFLLHTGYYYLCDGGYPNLKHLSCPFKWPGVGMDHKCLSHLESTRKDIELTFGSIEQIFEWLVNPLKIQEAHRIEQLFYACCVLHNIILDYNGADTLKAQVNDGVGICDADAADRIPITYNDVSYIHNHHQNDKEWIIIQDMENPSPDLRAPAHYFVNNDVSKVEIMVHLKH